MEKHYIYIVFSSTPYKIGKLIRRVTRETYNHISISLDKDLTQMYSFSRRYYRLPLYGGFVHESRSRYHVKGIATDICLCALPVTARQYATLNNLLQGMHRRSRFYIYNHLSVLGAVIHKPIRARDAYTCVEFCVKVLRELGIDIQPNKFYSVGDIQTLLAPYIVYSGAMPEPEGFDEEYYAEKPVPHPTLTTLREMLKLLPRLKT
ncbi:MAG: hypothetical protein IJZ56_03600 [Oscillospiraceae bacterium]|nr:hypothetical protein [Oscillospiraceae bacterium]